MAFSQEMRCERAYRNAEHSIHEIKKSRLIDRSTASADGEIVLELEPNEAEIENKNAWSGHVLADMAKEGFVATSVGGLKAWFKPIDAGLVL